ncbi:HpcH/HpaI aldolase family protein [Pleomorphovibrio marinus]|uniref:HpcH/HpaI aldolase family protein n=1 Tax=Pleomorphovibrio marinus TaxID=2164132 RepID=UPI000E0AC616|nr:aldolase/citrate lyase family protein [Pleomorphovibrio marinus]
MKGLKKRLQQGETLFGCWLNLGSPVTAEIVGLSGFDWVLLDLEHGAGEPKDLLHQLQALEHTTAAPVVRVESVAKERIHRILDVGAEGVMCPRIQTVDDARKAVSAMHYPPKGVRGVAKMVRATGFGHHFESYVQDAQENILGILQIETLEAMNHLDEIAKLGGVDVLFIGPADLTMALGIYGQLDHPKFVEAVDRIVAAAKKAGKSTGILLFNPDEFPTYQAKGIQLIACGSDATFVANGAGAMAKKLRGLRKDSNT